MIWYRCYCCHVFWPAWRSMCSVSFHRVRESCGRGSHWGGGVKLKTVVWNQRWWCPDCPIAFQKWLSFKTYWCLQGRGCSKRETIQHVVNKLSETFHPHPQGFLRTMTWLHTDCTGKACHHSLSGPALPAMPHFTWILDSSFHTATQGRCLGTPAGQLENGRCGGAKHITSPSVRF